MTKSILVKVLPGLLGLLVIVSVALAFRLKAGRVPPEARMKVISTSSPDCALSADIGANIEKLASESRESYEASAKLMKWATYSSNCRKEIIGQLVRAMDKPDLSLARDRAGFALWSKGSAILGELKAEEGLDLLINHLDLNDGFFSASMVHQPAVAGITRMGVVAIPKLAIALHHHPKRDIRLAAVLCLAEIRGKEAMDALNNALYSETDQCVRRLITLSLPPLSSGTPAKLSFDDAELLRERLRAFRCGN